MTIREAKEKLRIYFEEACDILEINHRGIAFVYEHIGKRFRTINNTCETSENILYINEDWILSVLKENFLYDLQYQMYHESRHFYQQKAIKDPFYRVRFDETVENVNRWLFEFTHYHRNEGTTDTQKSNATQFVEIDANAFAVVLLSKHRLPARAPEEQWQQTEQRANEIYGSLLRMGKI